MPRRRPRGDGSGRQPAPDVRPLLRGLSARRGPGQERQGWPAERALRCSLEGARFSRPGLLVTGEAAGATYAFTGEGIGKAMETGILAAETIAEGRDTLLTDAQLRARYEAALLALKPRFDLYERANASTTTWLADLLIWRARRTASCAA
jgi:flavin-dependent dehydrogenase